MKRLQLSLVLLVLFLPVRAQEYIGLTEKNVREAIAGNMPGLTPDNTVRNDSYRYLKYHSVDDNETWLVFFDSGGRCNGVRITSGNAGYEARVKEMNNRYTAAGLNSWTYKSGGQEISVKLKREEWFYTVTHERLRQR